MSQYLNFPLLDVMRASEEWSEAKSLSLSKITQLMSDIDIDTANFYHVGQRATRPNIEKLRAEVLAVALEYGFPQHSRARRDSGTAFDRAVAKTIHDLCRIAPAEAAKAELWNFINVRVLLDVLVWRWGTWEPEPGHWSMSQDRLFQTSRTAFGRLWWRVELMGDDATSALSEDQSVQLMERTRISGYRPLVDAITKRLRGDETTLNKDELLRVALKRLGRRMAVFSVFLMNRDDLDSLVDGIFTDSALAIVASRSAVKTMMQRPQVLPDSAVVWP